MAGTARSQTTTKDRPETQMRERSRGETLTSCQKAQTYDNECKTFPLWKDTIRIRHRSSLLLCVTRISNSTRLDQTPPRRLKARVPVAYKRCAPNPRARRELPSSFPLCLAGSTIHHDPPFHDLMGRGITRSHTANPPGFLVSFSECSLHTARPNAAGRLATSLLSHPSRRPEI